MDIGIYITFLWDLEFILLPYSGNMDMDVYFWIVKLSYNLLVKSQKISTDFVWSGVTNILMFIDICVTILTRV